MNSRRSYLESMNAGRPRRSTTSLEQLNRTLDELEGRIEDANASAGNYRSAPARPRHDYYREPAPSLEPNRAEEELTSTRQIANEFESLRRELRHQFGGNLKNEFAALRSDLIEALKSAQPTRQLAALSGEFERLAGVIHHLGERGGDEQAGLLRKEMGQIRNALDLLAREDTVRSADRRWDDFDRRWEEFTARLEHATADRAGQADIGGLSARLDEIGGAVAELPNSGAMRSLEDKLRFLASAVDQFVYQQGQIGPEALSAIDERLNEISRAIAATASAANAGVDTAVTDRLEARISTLARQIEELAETSAPIDFTGQIETLTQRIDRLVQSADEPDRDVARLGEQIAAIAGRLESGLPERERDLLFQQMDERLERVSTMLEQRHQEAMTQGRNLMVEMEQRLNERAPASQEDGAGLHHLESRLEEISARLEQASERTGILDADLAASLETQIAALSRQLAEPGPGELPADNIQPRLDAIEEAIARNRDELVEAARQAAEQTATHIMGSRPDAAGDIDDLSQDLRSLQDLTLRSDERNSRTFAAIHDTLIKIVNRLSAMADDDRAEHTDDDAHARIETGSTPPLEPVLDDHVHDNQGKASKEEAGRSASLLNPRTPASAAQEAAAAARADDEDETITGGQKSSILGKLTGAIGKRKQKSAATPVAAREEPELVGGEFDGPLDPELANQPLEPGSEAPDLNAIMRRVRDERKDIGGEQASEDAAKSDFIAAARRAARAAAAEADMAKRHPPSKDNDGKLAVARLFKHKKTLTLGVALVALTLTGLYVAPRYLAPGEAISVTGAAEPNQTVSLDSPATEFSRQAMESAGKVADAAPESQEPAMAPDFDDVRFDEADAAAAAASLDETQWLTEDQPAFEAETDEADEGVRQVAAADPSLFSPEFSAVGQTFGDVTATIEQEGAEEPGPPAIDFAIPQEAGPAVLREAAGDGDPRALYEIASRYQNGRGVEADIGEAAVWFERAAERGLAPAQYQIGNIYEKGLGVERDIDAAMIWYESAASQGNASAMHNLAVLHAMGASGRTDNRQAARWFHEAADLGVTDSQFNLGILAARGVGVEQDLVEAYKWFDIVARGGDSDAADKRDEVGDVLGDDGRERARQTAALWQAREPAADANHVDMPGEWTEDVMQTASVDVESTVRSVQTLLNELGYEAGPEDGMFGARTATAIAAFQGDNDLEPSGEIDGELVRALLAKQ